MPQRRGIGLKKVRENTEKNEKEDENLKIKVWKQNKDEEKPQNDTEGHREEYEKIRIMKIEKSSYAKL